MLPFRVGQVVAIAALLLMDTRAQMFVGLSLSVGWVVTCWIDMRTAVVALSLSKMADDELIGQDFV